MTRKIGTGIQPLWAALVLAPVALMGPGCGPAAGTQAHEMSAADHQHAAAEEQSEGTTHSAEYDSEAREKKLRCAPSLAANRRICWNEDVNPTSEHEAVARRHRELAAEHRAASQSLVSAEETACAGLDAGERDMSPFAHASDLQGVVRLRDQVVGRGGPSAGDYVGATVFFRAVPGLTRPWLQRILDCHLARNAALGHEVASADMPYCPLTLRGAHAIARETTSGFAVDLRAEDSATAEEIWRRAQRLVPGSE